jgi:5,10-methylene-tetrahydrofolate dehydrogenase/methenyl tetrahydrofolate cyclohydrolase
MLKNKPILIGIGITNINGKLGTDYEIDQISAKTSFYSKNPGGIGPVNIACLFQNLLDASEEINNKYQLAQS